MVAVVAHDLQNPLAGIRALLRALQADPLQAHGRELQEISRTCAEMHRLIAWLIEAHATETAARNPVAIDIAPILSEEVATGAALTEEKGITIIYHPIPFYALAEPALAERMGAVVAGSRIHRAVACFFSISVA